MNILSLNFNHDGAGCIVSDGILKAFLCTERQSRIKKHPGFRHTDLYTLLARAQMVLREIDVVLLNNIYVSTTDLLDLYGDRYDEEWLQFTLSPDNLEVTIDGITFPVRIDIPHHLQHAALVLYTSPFDSAVAWVWDPLGEGAFMLQDGMVSAIPEVTTKFSAANLYSHCAIDLFGSGLFGAGKMMGLAPYGKVNDPNFRIGVNPFNDAPELYSWIHTFSAQNPVYYESETGECWNARLAFLSQLILEESLEVVFGKLYKFAEEQGISPNICVSGGSGLNSVANERAFKGSQFNDIFIHPACGDDGTAIGAALYYYHTEQGRSRSPIGLCARELMYAPHDYNSSIKNAIFSAEFANQIYVKESTNYISEVAILLAQGNIIGWYQDGPEMGPRALGNRSILADPRGDTTRDYLNKEVKFREMFRPFAPAVLNEYALEYFSIMDSPFMLRVADVLSDKIPAVTHVDSSARVQTISREDNPCYYDLIKIFGSNTGVPVVLNTSFNIQGEPIVETPEDALRCFLATTLDYLVFPSMIISKASSLCLP